MQDRSILDLISFKSRICQLDPLLYSCDAGFEAAEAN